MSNCKSCNKTLRRNNESGYCWSCFDSNVDGAKTKYNKDYKLKKGLIRTDLIYICKGCNKDLKKGSKSGYCSTCFHNNVDDVKSKYNKQNWKSGNAKKSHYEGRGVNLTDEVLELHESKTTCDYCSKPFKYSRDKHLDHCHDTGKYRGTLCNQCNTSIGKLGDNIPLIIEKLTQYHLSYGNQT